MEFSHIPVLLNECLEGLAIDPAGIYLDGTAGGGGHSSQIAKRLTTGRLVSLDQDPDAIEAAGKALEGLPATLVQTNFCNARSALYGLGIEKINGALLDLGVSSHQLDDASRGFSYRQDAPLDMRMSQSGPTAADLVNTASGDELASILRALGNSRVPLYFLILAALLNIVLDLVLIIVFHMGAAGAAVATVISQGISGVLCLFYIIRKVPLLRLTRDDRHLSGDLLRTQIRIGIPMALQYSITAVGTMMVQSALNILGSTLVAAYTAAGKIEQIVTQAYVAMGTTMATYGAQNMGAGDVSRIRQGFKASTIIGVIYAIVSAALVMTVGKYMTYLFVSEDVALIMDSVNTYLICVGIFFIPLAIVNIYRNGIQGLGYGLLPMMAGVAELVGRGVVAVIAAGRKSYLGVCLASPAAWVLASLLLIGMYYYVVKIDLKKIFPDKYAGNKKKSGLRSR